MDNQEQIAGLGENSAKLVVVTTGSRGITTMEESGRDVIATLAAHYPEERWFYHGAARGWDSLIAELVKRAGGWQIVCEPVTREDWQRDGKSAGILRNIHMLEKARLKAQEVGADIVLLSNWDGESPGTRHMLKLGETFGVRQIYLGAKLSGPLDAVQLSLGM